MPGSEEVVDTNWEIEKSKDASEDSKEDFEEIWIFCHGWVGGNVVWLWGVE